MPNDTRDDGSPAPSDECTAPIDHERTSPHETGELRQLDREELRRVLELLASEPLRLRSDNLVPRPWGGRRLVEFKGLESHAAPGRIGESFEVAAYPLDAEAARYASIVEFSDGSSMPLDELLGRAGEAVLGPTFFAAFGPNIPLLPKFLDVEGLLSVQGHPPGHPEAYIIVEREPGASLRLGFRESVEPAALAERLHAARAVQEQLAELFWVSQERYAPIFAELLPAPDARRQLVDRLAPLLREPDARDRLAAAVDTLVGCYAETLALLNEIPVEPGMVLFNADPPGAREPEARELSAEAIPSSQIHCLGNPAGKATLLLEIRRPGVTLRAWDHVRFPLRELAIDEALAAVSTGATAPGDFIVEPRPVAGRAGVFRSVECPAFVIDHLRPRPGLAVEPLAEGLPTTLHAIRGTVRLSGGDARDWGLIRAGESLLLPAGVGPLRLDAQTPEAELVQVTIPVPARPRVEPTPDAPVEAKRDNLAHLDALIAGSRGPAQVLALVNGGDGPELRARLEGLAKTIFRADGAVAIEAHEEPARRGQLLGLLDALRGRDAAGLPPLDPDRVALGIMLPGKGTRLSPLTQRLHGIKPLFPLPICAREGQRRAWLDGATASLWTWVLVAATLERQGFRGIAWKWGDEPQIASRALAALDDDLSDVDAVRFGARMQPTAALAPDKEWLLVDESSGEFIAQLRRRSLAELRARIPAFVGDRRATSYVHVGSPAFSHLFLRHAERAFGDLGEGWIDVDGYLFEALTHDEAAWAAEVERDAKLRDLLARCPDYYARARALRRAVEAERGHPMRMTVVDLGPDLYWGDVGQLARARVAWAKLAADDGDFARRLAGLAAVEPDAHGNLILGDASRVPADGSVRDCVIIDAVIERGAAEGAVVFRSSLGLAGLERGAVAIDCHVDALRMEADSLAFGSIGRLLRVPAHFVHTSIVADPRASELSVDSWLADSRVDVSAPEYYAEPRWGNPTSFAAKFEQMRQREVSPVALEAAIATLARGHGAASARRS